DIHYAATDDRQLADYAVSWRYAATGQPLGAMVHPAAWQHLTARTLTVDGLRPGWTYCFTVSARDRRGNTSTRAAGCTVRPLDDRALTRSTRGWVRITGNAYYRQTATTTSGSGRTL